MTPSVPGSWKWRIFLAILLSLFMALLWIVDAQSASAQAVPIDLDAQQQEHSTATVAEAPKSDDGGSILGRIADGMADGIRRAWEHWLETAGITKLIDGFVTSMGQMAQSYLEGTAKMGPAGCDVMGELDADCVLDNPMVTTIMARSVQVFNVMIASGISFLGLYVLVSLGGSPLKELGPVVPRLVIAAWAVNNAKDVLRVVAQLASEIAHFLSADTKPLGEAIHETLTPATAGGTLTILAVIMVLLIIQRLMMHGLLIALAVTSGIAFAAAVIPHWSKWFWRWFDLLTGLVITAYLQTILLNTGTSMMVRAISGADDGSKALWGGLFAIGTIGTALSTPALVGAGGVVGGSAMGLLTGAWRRGARRLGGGGSRSSNGGRELTERTETETEEQWVVRSGGERDSAPGQARVEEVASTPREEPVVIYRSLTPHTSAAPKALPAESEYTEFVKKEDN